MKDRSCEIYFNDTCKLMRKYMRSVQPQSFASVWGLFIRLKRECESKGIVIGSLEDIYAYAKAERIERYGLS